MSLAETLKIIRRRWLIVICGLVLVVVAMAATLSKVPISYEATTALSMVPAKGSQELVLPTGEGNAYLGLDRDMAVAAGVARAAVVGDPDALPPELRGDDTKFELTTSGDRGTEVTVKVTSRDEATARAAAKALGDEVGPALDAQQAAFDVPVDSRITTHVAAPPAIERDSAQRVRTTAVVGGVGVVLVLFVAFAVEGLAQRRRARAAGVHLRGEPDGRVWPVRIGATLVALIVLGGIAAQIVRTSTTTWQSTATLALVPPKFPVNPLLPPSQQGTTNPFLSYSSSISTLARVAVTTWADDHDRTGDVVVQDWQAGATPVDTSAAPTPLITATASASSPEAAKAAVQETAERLRTIVRALQVDAGAPVPTLVSVTEAGTPTLAAIHSGRARAAAAFGLLVLGGAWVLGLGTERLVLARRRATRPDRRWQTADAT